MLKEFKEFAMKGNMLDLAVAVIIGGAFGKIVTSLVNDILMPPLGLLLGKVDFTNLYISLSGTTYDSLDAAKKAGAPTMNYGLFINNILDFALIALAVFLLVKQINRFKKPEPVAVVDNKQCPYCLSDVPAKATRCPFCTSQLEN